MNAAEAKERMMAMEAQLSQLTGMVQKALSNKELFRNLGDGRHLLHLLNNVGRL